MSADQGAAPATGGLRLMEQCLNRVLELDEETAGRLRELEGRVIVVELSGAGLAFELVPQGDSVRLQPRGSCAPDVTIRGRPSELLRHATGRSGGGHVEIAGDVELAQQLQRILAALDPDWEELLSQWIGDLPARSLSRGAAALARFGSELRESAAFSISEYLRFERRVLVDRPDVDEFVRAVDDLRDDVERLRARMQFLDRRAGGEGKC